MNIIILIVVLYLFKASVLGGSPKSWNSTLLRQYLLASVAKYNYRSLLIPLITFSEIYFLI